MTTTEPTAFEIKDYRQPLVTSLGVILGFLVGFLAQWITEDDFALHDATDWLVFAGCISGAAMLLRVLFRILSPPDSSDPLQRYRRTLRLYIGGIAVAFLSLITAAFL
jgi:cytochrome b561